MRPVRSDPPEHQAMNPSLLRSFALAAAAAACGRRLGPRHPAARRCHRRRQLRGGLSRRPCLQGAQQHHRHHGPHPRGLQRAAGRAADRAGRSSTSPGSVPGVRTRRRTALPAAERTEFVVRGTLTATAGPAVVQGAAELRRRQRRLGRGARRRAADKPAFPAARLDVLAPGVAAVEVRDAWVRFAVPGPERHRRLHDAGRAFRRAPDRRLDAGRPAWPRSTR